MYDIDEFCFLSCFHLDSVESMDMEHAGTGPLHMVVALAPLWDWGRGCHIRGRRPGARSLMGRNPR